MSSFSVIDKAVIRQPINLVETRLNTNIFDPAKGAVKGFIKDSERQLDDVKSAIAKAMSVAIANEDQPPIIHLLAGGAGEGKSWKTVEATSLAIRRGEIKGTVLHIVTDHDNAAQIIGWYSEHGVEATHVRGMLSSGCKRIEEVTNMASVGLSPRSLCGTQENPCPFYASCEYIKTRRDIKTNNAKPVVVIPLEYLRSGGIPEELNPVLVIGDESPISKLLVEKSIPISELGSLWISGKTNKSHRRLQELSKEIIASLNSEEDVVSYLTKNKTEDEVLSLISDVEQIIRYRTEAKKEWLTNATSRRKNSFAGRLNYLEIIEAEGLIWKSILALLQSRGAKRQPCVLHMFEHEKIKRIDISLRINFPYSCPVIVLDAGADEVIYKKTFADSHAVKLYRTQSSESSLRRFAIIGESFSRTSLTHGTEHEVKNGKYTRNTAKEAADRRERLSKLIESILAIEEDRKILLVSHSKVEELIKSGEIAPGVLDRGNIELAHYGNTKGRNDFQDFDTVIIVGKLELSDESIRRLTRCLLTRAEARNLYPPTENRLRIKRPLEKEDGRTAYMDTYVFPNDDMTRIQQMHRESEIIQAEGRLRSVRRAGLDLRSYIISDAIPGDLSFEDIFHVEDVIGSKKLEPIFDEYHGILSSDAYANYHQTNDTRAFNDLIKNKGISFKSPPRGWIGISIAKMGKRGQPMKAFYKGSLDSFNPHDCEDAVVKHMMKINKYDPTETLVVKIITDHQKNG